MPTSKHLLDIPKRALLSVETATAMRNAMDRGLWEKNLPSERKLCEMFHVSRPTIRSALGILAKEGLIGIQKRRRIRSARSGPPRSSVKGHKILFVTHELFSRAPPSTYRWISEMQAYLGRHGLESETYICKPHGVPAQLRKLTEFIRQNGVRCTLLVTVRREVQQWFAALALPTLVLGSCHPSVSLPSFDVDYRSVCRHAAGVFLSKGHKRLALILPSSRGPGDVASVAGFLEAVPESAVPGAPKAVIVYHECTAPNINARLDALFKSGHAPTALLVSNPKFVLIVMLYLLRKGLWIPDRISLVSRDQDPIFPDLVPPVSYYAFDINVFTRRMARLILKLIDQKYLPATPNLIFPRFVSGGTVRTLRASS